MPALTETDVPLEGPSHLVVPSPDQTCHTQPEEEAERPKSQFTPSYTVTTLPGSGSSPRINLQPELEETAEVEVPLVEKAEGTETPKIITPEDQEPVEPAAIAESPSWAQSYSVTSQPGSPRLSPRVGLKELEPEPRPVECPRELPVAASTVELADVSEAIVTPVVEDEDNGEPVPEEESKTAWAQSYSVTSQPGSPRVSPKQVPEEVSEVEEIKPSWTQSYSVISQPGSPRILPKEDLQEPTVEPVAVADDLTTVLIHPVEEATTVPADTETAEQPKPTWTPSYSVITLDGQTERAPLKDTEPEVVSVPESFVGEGSESNLEIGVLVTDTSEPLVVKNEQPERPKSPWTPSYSVTTLPGSSAEEPNPDCTDKPSADVEPPDPEPVETAETVEDQPKGNGTTSDVFELHEAVSQLTIHNEPQVDVEIPEPDRHELELVSLSRFRSVICSILK